MQPISNTEYFLLLNFRRAETEYHLHPNLETRSEYERAQKAYMEALHQSNFDFPKLNFPDELKKLVVFIIWSIMVLFLANGCSFIKQVTKTGFNTSTVFTVGGSTVSVDKKFVHVTNSIGYYTRYRVSDPQMRQYVIISRMIKNSQPVTKK